MIVARSRLLMLSAVVLCLGAGSKPDTKARLLEQQKEAMRMLQQAKQADRTQRSRLLREAARQLEALADAPTWIPAPERSELKRAAGELLVHAQAPAPFSPEAYLGLLERIGARLAHAAPLGLSFQGSYSETKIEEPAYGGHASAMGPAPVAPPPAAGARSGPSPVTFEEVPGLREKAYCGGLTKDHLVESGGSGIALLDYDGDGLLDVFAPSAYELDAKRQRIPHPHALYRNLGGGRFRNVAREAGIDAAAWGNGVCAGDYDDDGRIDLYVTHWGPNALYRNAGDGTFRNAAAEAGVEAGGWSTGCAFFDADGDGDLDLYVARYAGITWAEVEKAQRSMTWRGGPKVMVGPVGLPGAADVFFENRGGGSFGDATDARGLGDAARAYGFGVLASDYDGDGWPDLFVANDSNPNFLYHNRGDGRFESVGLLSGVALNGEGRAQAGMGVDAGDYDNDGTLDIVLTTFAHDNYSLYRNHGSGQFEDVSQAAGLAAPTFGPMGWGAAFLDADLDGRLDLFFANGHIYPQVEEFPDLKESFRQRNMFLLNEGSSFRDVSETAGEGLAVERSSRGLAVGDFDNDGDPDLVISNVDEAPTLLENKQRTGRHWIGIQLKKPGANPFAIGARVSLEAGGRRQLREVRSGGSYLSQSDLRVLFGLGSEAGPVDVEVVLGQARWRFKGLAADHYATLVLRDEERVRR